MASIADKLKSNQELPEVKKVPHAPENIGLSRDEFMEKRRKEKELAARLAIETEKIMGEIEQEEKVKKAKKKAPKIETPINEEL